MPPEPNEVRPTPYSRPLMIEPRPYRSMTIRPTDRRSLVPLRRSRSTICDARWHFCRCRSECLKFDQFDLRFPRDREGIALMSRTLHSPSAGCNGSRRPTRATPATPDRAGCRIVSGKSFRLNGLSRGECGVRFFSSNRAKDRVVSPQSGSAPRDSGRDFTTIGQVTDLFR